VFIREHPDSNQLEVRNYCAPAHLSYVVNGYYTTNYSGDSVNLGAYTLSIHSSSRMNGEFDYNPGYGSGMGDILISTSKKDRVEMIKVASLPDEIDLEYQYPDIGALGGTLAIGQNLILDGTQSHAVNCFAQSVAHSKQNNNVSTYSETGVLYDQNELLIFNEEDKNLKLQLFMSTYGNTLASGFQFSADSANPISLRFAVDASDDGADLDVLLDF
jgi:hypothetical protein